MIQCVFCTLPETIVRIAENDEALAFYDAFPVNPGHALIIPKRHVASYFELTPTEIRAMHELLSLVKSDIEKNHRPDGYNIGINIGEAAGQSVFHVHMHVIPRYLGDVTQPKGGVRGVIPSRQSY